jgi:hypothetical protein
MAIYKEQVVGRRIVNMFQTKWDKSKGVELTGLCGDDWYYCKIFIELSNYLHRPCRTNFLDDLNPGLKPWASTTAILQMASIVLRAYRTPDKKTRHISGRRGSDKKAFAIICIKEVTG